MLVSSYTFNPEICKSFFNLPSKEDYITSQYCSVSTRLLFEYKKCSECGGLCYFVTFTYNNNGVFNFLGRNFLDNYDIRYLFNKSIFSRRMREHNYTFKYASFGELGDGKGIRGKGNNPHYHVLIFLYGGDGFYNDDVAFLTLCHNCWNSDLDSTLKSFKSLNRGNVSYSKQGAKVKSADVFPYCASYCMEMLGNFAYRNGLFRLFKRVAFDTLFHLVFNFDSIYLYPFDNFFIDRFCSYRKDLFSTDCLFSDSISKLYFHTVSSLCKFYNMSLSSLKLSIDFDNIHNTPVFSKIMDLPIFHYFFLFLYNQHCVKYQISKNLGSSGLDYIDTSNFLLDVSFFPSLKKSKINLPSYYFRKLLFSRCVVNGHPLLLPNSLYNSYVSNFYSLSKYNSFYSSCVFNWNSFKCSLPSDLISNCPPPSAVAAFLPFQYLAYRIGSEPLIDNYYPWDYITRLDYTQRDVIYSRPVSADFVYSTDGYRSFTMHSFFSRYPNLSLYTSLYRNFIRKSFLSSEILNNTLDYFKYKSSSSYEVFNL